MTPTDKRIADAVEIMRTTVNPCLFCGEDVPTKPGVIGIANYSGDSALLMGAPPGKERLALYVACTECASKFESAEALALAADSALIQQVTFSNKETLQ